MASELAAVYEATWWWVVTLGKGLGLMGMVNLVKKMKLGKDLYTKIAPKAEKDDGSASLMEP
eukprot:CAMPEP_0204344686 /NCGR_PEP_ID=MMETSP0469-20131031/25808_1 /ASSEMBLY_ACC=CAM_ASM_000384 /TAXON_ID=2969 /ORGANISM="Oxyrrhis marina" /LENGTH=61 /DNA_ID=CAMNT_0051329973 /DNA_START=6 /DNA_END=188 /DNA_ORIENTATION=+